jgi:hypothetical protein
MADWDGERATQEDRLAGTTTANSRDNFGVAAQHQMLWPRSCDQGALRTQRELRHDLAPRGSIVYVARVPSSAVGETRLKASRHHQEDVDDRVAQLLAVLPATSISSRFRRACGSGHRSAAGRRSAKAEVTWFDNCFSNIISPQDPATFEASSSTSASHAHVASRWTPGGADHSIRARASYTWLDPEIVETTSPGNVLFAPGQWARPRTPVGVTFDWQRLTADVNGTFVGRLSTATSSVRSAVDGESRHSTWETRCRRRCGRSARSCRSTT